MSTSTIYRFTELTLVWGPLDLPDDAVSFADDWNWVIYTPEEIEAAILSVPCVKLIHDSRPDWRSWRAQWRSLDRTIDFDLIACDLDPEDGGRPGCSLYWGGSSFTTNCTLTDMLDVWTKIQMACPAVWLHDTVCRMYNPRSFVADLPGKIQEWSR
ncbi:MAG: hypothetical protein KDB03_26935 [Planctomycetales bacterium]|nr:hypothetical protein [Planctomycetales bacterium]